MNKTTGQKVNMYKAVLEICKAHEQDWASIPGFVETIAELETAIHTLDVKAQLQSTKTIGVMSAKLEKMDALHDCLLLLHGALEIHGKMIGNSELRVRNGVNSSDIKRMSIPILNVHLNQIVEDLNAFGGELVHYGISATDLVSYAALIEEARHSSSRPRMAIIERKLYTKSIDDQTLILDEIIKVRLDKLIRVFKKTIPDFYQLYFNARHVIDQAHKKPENDIPPISPAPIEPDDGVV